MPGHSVRGVQRSLEGVWGGSGGRFSEEQTVKRKTVQFVFKVVKFCDMLGTIFDIWLIFWKTILY